MWTKISQITERGSLLWRWRSKQNYYHIMASIQVIFSFFLLQYFNDNVLFLSLSIKLISGQLATWFFIPQPFNVHVIILHEVYYAFLQSENPNSLISPIGLRTDSSLSFIKDCHSIKNSSVFFTRFGRSSLSFSQL